MADSTDETRQVLIVHLSDVHFGARHRFNPPASPSGDVPDEIAYPTLIGNFSKIYLDLIQIAQLWCA